MSVPNPATTDWVPIFAGGNPLAYRGDFVAGTYQDGDIVVQNGIAFLCVGGPTSVAPDITPWGGAVANRPAGELGYMARTTAFGVSTSPIAFLGPITVACDGVTPLIVEANFPSITLPGGVGSSMIANLWMDGASYTTLFSMMNVVTGQEVLSARGVARIIPPAGTHIFDVRLSTSSGSGNENSTASSPAWMRITQANPVLIAPAGPTVPTYGLSLPASPADGQEHVLVDSLTNPSYQWRFRFNAGSASTYKWEFVGGTTVIAEVNNGDNITSTTYINGAIPGPSLVVPRAGDYEIGVGCALQTSINSQQCFMSYDIGATPAIDADAVTAIGITGGNPAWGAFRARRKDALGAGITLLAKYKTSTSTMYFSNRWLRMTPIRVA